jgi:hypothetical protein
MVVSLLIVNGGTRQQSWKSQMKMSFHTAYKPVFWPMRVLGKEGLHKNWVTHWSGLHVVQNGSFWLAAPQ